MNTILILISAFFPAVLLWLYVWKKDTQREPTTKLIKAVLWGMVICMPVAVLEIGIQALLLGAGCDSSTFLGIIMDAFCVAAIPEELFKLLALWIVLRKNPYFDEHFDGIVYAVSIGLGFAAVENLLYLFGEEEWVSTAIIRALLAVPGHYAFAVLMGYYYSVYHFIARSPQTAVRILLIPILVHGIYDTIAMSGSINSYISIVSFFVLIWFCVKMHKVAKLKIVTQIERDEKNNRE